MPGSQPASCRRADSGGSRPSRPAAAWARRGISLRWLFLALWAGPRCLRAEDAWPEFGQAQLPGGGGTDLAEPSTPKAPHEDQEEHGGNEEELGENETEEDDVNMTLKKNIQGFVLAGDHEASLRDINGGRLCVDLMGMEPPGWQINGTDLDLETCAMIASEQQGVVGFKWGMEAFDHKVFSQYASLPGFLQPANITPVDLIPLFNGSQLNFSCLIYMRDSDGNVPELNLSNFTKVEEEEGMEEESPNARRLKGHSSHRMAHKSASHARGRRSGSRAHGRSHGSHHGGHSAHSHGSHHGSHAAFHHAVVPGHLEMGTQEEEEPGRPEIESAGPVKIMSEGAQVCLQRRSLLQFCDMKVTELWFCYLPEKQWPKCEASIKEQHLEGLGAAFGTLLVVIALSYIMQNQQQFIWALSWVARFIACMECGVWAVVLLLYAGLDALLRPPMLAAVALLLVVLGANLLLLPYSLCALCGRCPVFALAYLLVLVIFPVVSIDWISYINPFVLLVDHWPILLGLLGFGIEALKQRCFSGNDADACLPKAGIVDKATVEARDAKDFYKNPPTVLHGLLDTRLRRVSPEYQHLGSWDPRQRAAAPHSYAELPLRMDPYELKQQHGAVRTLDSHNGRALFAA